LLLALASAVPRTRSNRERYKITNPQVSEGNFKEKEKLVAVPRWTTTPRQTVGRKLTLTSTSRQALFEEEKALQFSVE
jgi:hypothetical protein